VLPFVNMSADPEQQYFGDGITEDIITELSRFHSLLVIARNSSFQYRAATDVKQIAQNLRVQYVVEGSVRRSGGRARITAQLIEGETGNHLWAEHYDRTIEDLFIVQDEVARAIAATIEGRMAASGARRSRRKPTNDLAAYDYFLQGRESVEQRGDTDAAARLLRRAIELDPKYAQAYAWLSRLHIHLYHSDLRLQTLSEAHTLAEQALSLDEADAWCHAALGFAYLIAGKHELAGLHLNRAVALNPVDVRITSQRALWCLIQAGATRPRGASTRTCGVIRSPVLVLGLSRRRLIRGPPIRRGDPGAQSIDEIVPLGLLLHHCFLCASRPY
jgi:adenylate cyclase